MKRFNSIISRNGFALLLAGACAQAFAQVAVVLPDTSQTTTLNATITEQAKVQVPATVAFTVNDISSNTASAAQSVTITNIALDSATSQLKISVQANAASFTPPVALANTYAAGDVSWNAATWTNATGVTGTLSNTAYNQVATCAADSAACNTTGLVFTIGPKTTIKRSGLHSMVITWKFEEVSGA